MTSEERRRYAAQLRLPEIGEQGMMRLKASAVLIVGCGALGSVAAMYLAGAGVGKIIIADFDTVEVSNLHRQPFFATAEAGLSKAYLLSRDMRELNPDVCVLTITKMITPDLLSQIYASQECDGCIDFIIDAADNPATTYMIDDFCRHHGVAYTTACVGGWKAQLLTWCPGATPFSDLFPRPADDAANVLPCSLTGLAGPLSGMTGTIQAAEAIKFICGIGNLYTDRLFTVDLLSGNFHILPV